MHPVIVAILSGIVICGGMLYKKVEVAQAILSYSLPIYNKDITFIASVAPLHCLKGEVYSLKWNISLTSVRTNLDFIKNVVLPRATRIANNAAAYDDTSRQVKSSLLAEVRSIDASTAAVDRNLQDIENAEGIWAAIKATVSGLFNLPGLVSELKQGWDVISSDADAYVKNLQTPSTGSSIISATASQSALWLFENLYSEKQKVEILTSVIDTVIDIASQNTIFKEFYNTGCLNDVIEEAQAKVASSVISDTSYYQFQLACLTNHTSSDINYQWRWGAAAEWASATLKPGYGNMHSSSSNETFQVKFDRNTVSRDPALYWLRTKRAGDEDCAAARRHQFVLRERLDIATVN